MGQTNKKNPNSSTIALTLIAAGIILILISLIWELFKSLSAESSITENRPAQTSQFDFKAVSLVPHVRTYAGANLATGFSAQNSIQIGGPRGVKRYQDPTGEAAGFPGTVSQSACGESIRTVFTGPGI